MENDVCTAIQSAFFKLNASETKKSHKVKIDKRVFDQIFIPIKTLIDEENQISGIERSVSTVECIDWLIDKMSEVEPYLKTAKEKADNEAALSTLSSLKKTLRPD